MDVYTKILDGLLNVQRSLDDLLNWSKAHLFSSGSFELSRCRELFQQLENVREQVGEVSETLRLPMFKFIQGRLLSEEEFHMLMGPKILTVKRGTGFKSDYEFFMFYYYKDDDSEGYIDINSPLPQKDISGWEKGRFRLSGQIEPEKVRIKRLRDDQKKFFENNFPEIFARFSGD
jgi:hypothetical protein